MSLGTRRRTGPWPRRRLRSLLTLLSLLSTPLGWSRASPGGAPFTDTPHPQWPAPACHHDMPPGLLSRQPSSPTPSPLVPWVKPCGCNFNELPDVGRGERVLAVPPLSAAHLGCTYRMDSAASSHPPFDRPTLCCGGWTASPRGCPRRRCHAAVLRGGGWPPPGPRGWEDKRSQTGGGGATGRVFTADPVGQRPLTSAIVPAGWVRHRLALPPWEELH